MKEKLSSKNTENDRLKELMALDKSELAAMLLDVQDELHAREEEMIDKKEVARIMGFREDSTWVDNSKTQPAIAIRKCAIKYGDSKQAAVRWRRADVIRIREGMRRSSGS